MPDNPIKPKRSNSSGYIPLAAELEAWELAVNWRDGRLFTKGDDGNVIALTIPQNACGSGSSYTLPTASASVLGGIKIGTGLSIDGNGVVTASGGGGSSSVAYYATSAGFPATGDVSTLYVATDPRRIFGWDSSGVYIELGPG